MTHGPVLSRNDWHVRLGNGVLPSNYTRRWSASNFFKFPVLWRERDLSLMLRPESLHSIVFYHWPNPYVCQFQNKEKEIKQPWHFIPAKNPPFIISYSRQSPGCRDSVLGCAGCHTWGHRFQPNVAFPVDVNSFAHKHEKRKSRSWLLLSERQSQQGHRCWEPLGEMFQNKTAFSHDIRAEETEGWYSHEYLIPHSSTDRIWWIYR